MKILIERHLLEGALIALTDLQEHVPKRDKEWLLGLIDRIESDVMEAVHEVPNHR